MSTEDASHFDFEKISAYFDGDKAIISNFLSLIITELHKSEKDIERQIVAKDLFLLREAGHKLKGTGLSASLPKLTQIAMQINQLTSFEEAGIDILLAQLKAEIATIMPLVEKRAKLVK